MPIFFYFLVFTLFIFSIRKKKANNDGFFDLGSSTVIKGFFILLIVFSHITNYFTYSGFLSPCLYAFKQISRQLIVSMFFFISGYGIILSVVKKGVLYSKSIFTNRLLRLILYTVIGLLPYYIYSASLGQNHPVYDYFLAIIGLASFGNECWFIFAIFVCYFLCAFAYLFKWNNKYIPIIFVSIGILVYIFIMYFLRQPYYTWDTIICFVYGMLVAAFKSKIELLLSKRKFIPWLLMTLSLVILIPIQYIASSKYSLFFPEIVEMWFGNLFFCLFFVCFTKIFSLRSRPLSFIGKKTYPIYIMHMFVINCFLDFGFIGNEWLNYSILFVCSVMIGVPFFYVNKIADKYLINPIVKWNRKLIRDFDCRF